jgi:predicted Zn-dependent protease
MKIKLLAPNLCSYKKIKLVFFGLLMLLSSSIYAHGDLSMRIDEKTEEILKSPNVSELYYERGFLYQQHEDYNKAIEDYLKSESLGNNDKVLHYRKAQSYLFSEEKEKAYKSILSFLDIDNIDVKGKKLEAQILYKLQKFDEALVAYSYVVKTMTDIRPTDIIEYCDIILSVNNQNYNDALTAIEFGLEKLGKNTLSLHLKKLDYLKTSNQVEKALEQYNYFILEYNRKEFWYYKKAKYLIGQSRLQEANISLQLAKVSINQLETRFQQTPSIKKLNQQINTLENTINLNSRNHD